MKRLRFKQFLRERNQFSRSGEETLLSVSEYYGVKPRSEAFEAEEYETRAATLEGYRIVKSEDLVMNYMLAWKGAYGVSQYDGIVSPAYSVFKVDKRIVDVRYLHHRVRSDDMKAYFRSRSKGIIESRLRLYPDNLLASFVEIPEIETQRQIADFLDHETARIDLLIEKKQRLVALWHERIDAEVSNIVLQASGTSHDLKDTGVDWLGSIPSSWQLSRIGWELQRATYGFTNPMPTEDEGPFLLTANDVNFGRILWETARHTSQHAFEHDLTDKSRPKKGDVLLTKDGTLGRVAIHDGRPACINQSVALLRPRKNRITSEFLANVLLSRRYQDRMVFEAGGTTIKHIYISRLQQMPLPVPPQDEQRMINDKIRVTRLRVQRLGDKINVSIDRLKEYRSALITAAVTGQIDVKAATRSGAADRRLDALREEMDA